MAIYDCEECPKNIAVNGVRPCKQPLSHICPYHIIREGAAYQNTLRFVLEQLQISKARIEKDRKEPWHLDEYYQKICILIDEIQEATDEKLINEYRELFEITA